MYSMYVVGIIYKLVNYVVLGYFVDMNIVYDLIFKVQLGLFCFCFFSCEFKLFLFYVMCYGKIIELVLFVIEYFLVKIGLLIEERCCCNVFLSVYFQFFRELIFYVYEIFLFYFIDFFILCLSQKLFLGELNCIVLWVQMNFI